MSEFFRTTPPGLLTDDDAGFLTQNWGAVPAGDQRFYAAKLNEWQNFRHHYPRPLTPSEAAERTRERKRLGEIFEDFDKATQGDDLGTLRFADSDQAPAIKQGLANRAFVQHMTGLDGEKLERDYELARDALAKKHFGGAGVADDTTFHAKAAEWVRNENGKDDVHRSLIEAGRRAAAWEGAGLAESQRPSLKTWQESQSGKPGYELDFNGDYERIFKAAQAEAKAEFDRLRPYVDAAWTLLNEDDSFVPDEPGPVDFESLADSLMGIPYEDRRKVLAMVKARAELLPEKQQEGFWSKADKTFRRTIEGMASGAFNELPRIVSGLGSLGAQDLERQTLYEDIRNLRWLDMEPVAGRNMGESAGLAIVGSLPGMALTSGGGWMLNIPTFASDARQTMRSEMEKKGISPQISGDLANGFALPAGVAMGVLERVTFGMADSMPGVKQLQAKLLTRLTESGVKRALAIGGAFTLEAVEQNVQEALQDSTPLILVDVAQSLGAPLPEVEAWTPAMQTMTDPAAWAVSLVFAGVGFGRMPQIEAASILRERGASNEQIERVLAAPDANTWRTAVLDAVQNPAGAPIAPVEADMEAGQAADREAAGVVGLSRDAQGWWVEHKDGRRTRTESAAAAQILVDDLAQVNSQDEADAFVELADSWAATDPRAKQSFTGERVTSSDGGVFASRDGESPRLVLMDTKTAAAMAAEMELLARAEGAGGPVTRVVAGSNALEFRRRVGEEAQAVVERLDAKQNVGGDVLTMIHERVEATWRAAVEEGRIGMAETFRAIRRVEAALGRAILSEDPSEDEVRETVSELAAADVLGRRKDGSRLPAGSISKGLTAAINSAVDPQERATLGKFRAFLRAVRAFWRRVFQTAAAMAKARRDGKLKEGDEWSAFVDKLLGIDGQKVHETAVAKEEGMTLDGDSLVAEGEIQQYFDFHGVPQEKAKKGKKAFKAAGIGQVSDPGGMDRGSAAEVAAARAVALRAWRGVMAGDATPEERAAGLAALEQGAVSSLVHQFVSREIPGFDIRGAVINSPADFHQLALAVRSPFFESSKIAVLDKDNKVIGSQIVTVGSINEAIVGGREIVAAVEAIANRSTNGISGWVFSHNHPSGNPMPSQADIDLTDRLSKMASVAGHPLLDHVITNGEHYYSFFESGRNPAQMIGLKDRNPTVVGGIADWEVVSRSKLKIADNPFTLAEVAKLARTADPEHAHLFFFGTKLQVMAVERVDLSSITRQIARGAGREGATQVAISLPQGTSEASTQGWIKYVLNSVRNANLPVKVIDVGSFDANWKFQSSREAGLMEGESTFALSSATGLERLARQIENRQTTPREKARVFNRMAAELAGMARSVQFSDEVSQIVRIGEIRQLAKLKRVELAEKYENEALDTGVGDVLAAADLAKVRGQPFLAWLTDSSKGNQLRSRLMSRTRAAREGRYDPDVHGDFDGAMGLPRWIFNGNQMPDQVAQAAFEDGVLPDASADTLWQKITDELDEVAKWRSRVRAAEGKLMAARKRAADEARAWETQEIAKAKTGNEAVKTADARRALVILDKMLMTLPAEVRGKVGGFTAVSELKSNDARFNYFARKVVEIDRVLEHHLRNQYLEEIRELFRTSAPRMAAGEKDKGKIGVDAHAWMQEAERISRLSAADLEAEEAAVEKRLASPTLSDETVSHYRKLFTFATDEAGARLAVEQHEALLNLFGAIYHRQDGGVDAKGHMIPGPPIRNAGEIFAALEAAQNVVDTGRLDWWQQIVERRERRQSIRTQAVMDVGGPGGLDAVEEQSEERRGMGQKFRNWVESHFSFEGFASSIFGQGSATHQWADETSLQADLRYRDSMRARERALTDFLRSLWPRSSLRQRQKRLEQLATSREVPNATPGMPRMSEMDAVHFTMLWADQDTASREWLEQWRLGEDAQKVMEAWLSEDAKAIRRWLAAGYDTQYDEINAVFRRMYGVNLPRVKNYAPRLVDHGGNQNEMQMDPLQEGRQLMAGFTKRRRIDVKSPPRQVDALTAYWQNAHAVEYWKAWAESTSELRAVFSHYSTHAAVKSRWGNDTAIALNQWIGVLERNGIQNANGQGMLRRWSSAMADFALVGKLGVLAKQMVAGYASASQIGIPDFLRSLQRIATGESAISLREMYRSDTIQRRLPTVGQEVRVAVRGRGLTPIEAQLDRFLGLVGTDINALDNAHVWLRDRIGAMDAVFTTLSAAAAYDSAYRDAVAAGVADADARRLAADQTEKVVADTAQPETVRDKSLGELRGGLYGRILMPFQSANRQALGMTLLALKQGRTREAVQMAAIHWMATGIVAQTVGNLIRSLASADDVEDIWEWEDYARAIGFGPLTGARYLGMGIEAVAPLIGGFERRTAAVPLSEGIRLLRLAFRGEWDFKSLTDTLGGVGLMVGGRASWAAIAANVLKQGAGVGDTLTWSEEEADGKQAKLDRETIREAKKQEPGPEKSDEQKAAEKARRRAREAAQAEAIRRAQADQ